MRAWPSLQGLQFGSSSAATSFVLYAKLNGKMLDPKRASRLIPTEEFELKGRLIDEESTDQGSIRLLSRKYCDWRDTEDGVFAE